MKKLLPGVIAILLAVGCTAFVSTPTTKLEKKSLDPCGESSKQWFLINLDCNAQVNLTDVRDPNNYRISSTAGVDTLCNGSTCVCAIWACPTGPTHDRPDIGSATTIYTKLYYYFNYGMTYSEIRIKDEQN